jgi:hypothetical protein
LDYPPQTLYTAGACVLVLYYYQYCAVYFRHLGPEAYVESLGQRVCQRNIACLEETMVPIESIFVVLQPVFGGEVVDVSR